MPNLEWKAAAIADLPASIDCISDENPERHRLSRIRLRTRRPVSWNIRECIALAEVNGTREMVVHPNYVVIYSDDADTVTILRVLHAAQQWP